MVENVEDLHNFIQFKLLSLEGIKKCQTINNEEKNGQTIILDKYNSRDVSIIMNSLKSFNYMRMSKNENLNNLDIFFKNIKQNKEVHNKALAMLNSRLINKW
ncbi:uncharacterized protein LOC114131331 [Aphis gossypii]|uniref:uncharacterized protein LOC114131331 n=1 Tax=Aphis gossypii TaxID=80765 RepID=UPI0021596F4E|nr:uncharacterized protein LOC114131331 [Aphis gossypii]